MGFDVSTATGYEPEVRYGAVSRVPNRVPGPLKIVRPRFLRVWSARMLHRNPDARNNSESPTYSAKRASGCRNFAGNDLLRVRACQAGQPEAQLRLSLSGSSRDATPFPQPMGCGGCTTIVGS
eukprot:2968016-Rhodomonas_salina.1